MTAPAHGGITSAVSGPMPHDRIPPPVAGTAQRGRPFKQNGWGVNRLSGQRLLMRDLKHRPAHVLAAARAVSNSLLAFVTELNARPEKEAASGEISPTPPVYRSETEEQHAIATG